MEFCIDTDFKFKRWKSTAMEVGISVVWVVAGYGGWREWLRLDNGGSGWSSTAMDVGVLVVWIMELVLRCLCGFGQSRAGDLVLMVVST